jgi:hypothetical protein
VLEAQQDDRGCRPSQPRLILLREALKAASEATKADPNSLSAAALRATLVVNVLVEESSSSGGPGPTGGIKAEFSSCMQVGVTLRPSALSRYAPDATL